jgi:hypothetical protein
MTPTILLDLLAASGLLFVAHVVRAARVALLFPPGYSAGRFNLLLGLSIAYAINTILPGHLGEIARIWFVGKRSNIRFTFSAAVVAAERLSDVVVVAIAATSLAALSQPSPEGMQPLLLAGAALAAALFGIGVAKSRRMRRAIWLTSSIFNDRIRFAIVDFCWSYSELVTSRTLLARHYMLSSIGMWLLYVAAYAFYAHATDSNVFQILAMLLGAPLRSVLDAALAGNRSEAGMLLLFMGLPVAGVLLYGAIAQGRLILRLLRARPRLNLARSAMPRTTHDRFNTTAEYDYFLVSHFGGADEEISSFGLEALDDGVVHRLFNGGSGAITALVDVNGQLVIRKFATGATGRKLKVQADWLTGHQDIDLPLVEVVHQRAGEGFFLYDMPLVVPANDFFDVIHTSPIERSRTVLHEVAAQTSLLHQSSAAAPASDALIAAYLQNKVVDNAREVLDFARDLLPGDDYSINGKPLNLDAWDRLLDADWLRAQITDGRTSTIHGDLTIENIIVAPYRTPGWYIIDPNSENIFNTPLIDWSKLMQSLHLGYEAMNRHPVCHINGENLSLSVTRSAAYSELHKSLEGLIMTEMGCDALREVYFHEIINYLRLTPYKIRQSAAKGRCFFACTSLLLDRYEARRA